MVLEHFWPIGDRTVRQCEYGKESGIHFQLSFFFHQLMQATPSYSCQMLQLCLPENICQFQPETTPRAVKVNQNNLVSGHKTELEKPGLSAALSSSMLHFYCIHYVNDLLLRVIKVKI